VGHSLAGRLLLVVRAENAPGPVCSARAGTVIPSPGSERRSIFF